MVSPHELPRDVAQFEIVAMTIQLPALHESGVYDVIFDMVVEGLTWFGDRGSKTGRIRLHVE